MIENPQVGQRVAVIDMYGVLRIATVAEVADRRLVRVEDGGWSGWFGVGSVRDASALRAEAQRLLDAADKLESEADDDSVCYCGDLMRDHKAYGSCTSPRVMPTESALEAKGGES